MIMNTEERYIRNKAGNANPFRVPEGYFDSFPARIMESLPESEAVEIPLRRSFAERFRPVMYAAACLLLAVFGTAIYMYESEMRPEKAGAGVVASGSHTSGSSTYEEALADYAMMDNTDIYAYLSGE